MHLRQQQCAAAQFDQIGAEHHPTLWKIIGHGTGKCSQQGIRKTKEYAQRGCHPASSVLFQQQADGGNQQGTVRQRAEKLRCDNIEKSPLARPGPHP